MLKFIFWSLLLANVGLFAYERGYLDSWIPTGREPGRLARQFKPEAMKQLPPAAVTALLAAPVVPATPPEPAVPTAPVAPVAPTTPATPVATGAPVAKPETLVCKEIGNFDAASAKKFESQLQPLALGDRLSRHDIDEVATKIVYIPSQGSKEGADKKVGELKHLGVTDFYVIQDPGELHWGISLGVFKTEQSARALLAALMEKGVHSARLGNHVITAGKVSFKLRGLDTKANASLTQILTAFPHTEEHNCTPANASEPKAAVKTTAQVAANAGKTDTPATKPSLPREATH